MIGGSPPGSSLRTFQPVIERLCADAHTHFGVSNVSLIPVSHEERPFSYVLRVTVCHEDRRHVIGHAFLKIFKPKELSSGIDVRGRVTRDFETTSAIYEFLSQWTDVGAVRPIACYPDLLAIVTEEVSGPTLLDRLRLHARWRPRAAQMVDLVAIMTASGLWLKRFQGFDTRHSSISLDSLLEYVDVRLRRLVEEAVITGRDRDRIRRHMKRLAGDIEAAELREVAIHADLAPTNMLVCGRRIVVLDFAMAGRGSYLHDISRLFLQLDILRAKPYYRPGVIDVLQQALLRGLDPTLTADNPLFRYLLMQHRINHLGTLALKREPFPASILSARVRLLHRRWIGGELAASRE